jgi:manganese/zinc/iron transport system permease protein
VFELIQALFTDYTLRNVALGSAVLGVVSGVLGSFAVLRRQGLLGDALAHATLPGICIAFLLAGGKAPLALLLGAAISGWLGMLFIGQITRLTRIKEDAALGIVLAVFFGLGVVLLSMIQQRSGANQAGLDSYLFGQAATLVAADVRLMSILGGGALLVVALLYKELKLFTFDPAFAASLGFGVGRLNMLLTSLIVIAVVIGLQTVGVVLMAAMLVAPAAAARQWTNRLSTMVLLAGLFGASAGIGGALVSVSATRIPTGPMVILCAALIVVVSLLFAPARGLVWDGLRRRNARGRLSRAATRTRVSWQARLRGEHGEMRYEQ